MERLGTDYVIIKDLNGYDEVEARTAMARVATRAESVKELGLLHLPIVRIRDRKIVSGFDRLASCVMAGMEKAQVMLIECDDTELERIRFSENAHRRHYPGEQSDLMVKLTKAYEEAEKELEFEDPPPPEERPNGGRQKTPKGRAREKVAKEMGIKPDSVRRQQTRVKQREEEKQERRDKLPMFGRKVDDSWLAGVELALVHVTEAHNKVKAALVAITKLSHSGTPYPNSALQKMYENLQTTANYLKDCKPVGMCPFCKHVPEVRAHCTS